MSAAHDEGVARTSSGRRGARDGDPERARAYGLPCAGPAPVHPAQGTPGAGGEPAITIVMVGRYLDALERTPDGWRFRIRWSIPSRVYN